MLLNKVSKKLKISSIQKKQIYANNVFKSLIVTIEKDMNMPVHPAPANAILYMISGKVEFNIDNVCYRIEGDDVFTFSKGKMHELKALEDSKFLISRTHE